MKKKRKLKPKVNSLLSILRYSEFKEIIACFNPHAGVGCKIQDHIVKSIK